MYAVVIDVTSDGRANVSGVAVANVTVGCVTPVWPQLKDQAPLIWFAVDLLNHILYNKLYNKNAQQIKSFQQIHNKLYEKFTINGNKWSVASSECDRSLTADTASVTRYYDDSYTSITPAVLRSTYME